MGLRLPHTPPNTNRNVVTYVIEVNVLNLLGARSFGVFSCRLVVMLLCRTFHPPVRRLFPGCGTCCLSAVSGSWHCWILLYSSHPCCLPWSTLILGSSRHGFTFAASGSWYGVLPPPRLFRQTQDEAWPRTVPHLTLTGLLCAPKSYKMNGNSDSCRITGWTRILNSALQD
ncbi:hypothetical protein Y1Q_0019720 [Alligator mississippiensis]|uniref:Uncharacterized protein n=1 Tax=Alligator mississippiensis TaxID=8496 RepID=A0A151PF51_ALLMI|nr:hypothetical protein Y1Q_0019720 [Alligator mississippiensis]